MAYVGLPSDAVVFQGLPEGAQIIRESAGTGNMKDYSAMSPQEKAQWKAERDKAIAAMAENPNLTQARQNVADVWRESSLSDIPKEPVRLANELVTAPINSLQKARAGVQMLADVGLRGKTAEESARQRLGEISPVHGVAEPSKFGQLLGGLIAPTANAAESATGNTGLVKAGVEAGSDIMGLMPIAGAAKLAPIAKEAITSNPRALLGSVGIAKDLVEKPLPDVAKLTAKLDTSFDKAVRPGVASKRNLTQSDKYVQDARNAVTEIVLNKDNLNLVDEFGEPTNALPKTLPQFRQAIDSTKKNLWDKVEQINAAAGESGATVPLEPAVNELTKLSQNPVYKTMAPETVDYALKKADALKQQKEFTIADAQDAVTLANQSAANFHNNPTADTASRAYVDAMVANHIRAGLDTAIEQATGTPAAAPLRQAYGSLKAIEKDVNQRAVVDARKNAKGLVDFSDIYTAGELMAAMATLNPVLAAKTGTMAAVKAWIKRENNPNTHVERVFKIGEQLVNKPSDKALYPAVQRQQYAPLTIGEFVPNRLKDQRGLVGLDINDYQGEHTPPMKDSGAPLNKLNDIYPDDIYSPKAAQYYGHYGQNNKLDLQTISLINSYKDKPNAAVTIYRAIPKELSGAETIAKLEKQKAEYLRRGKMPSNASFFNGSKWYEWANNEIEKLKSLPQERIEARPSINKGDWVTINKNYAKEHGESALNGKYQIISKKVKAKDIYTNGDSIHEWGYDPQ